MSERRLLTGDEAVARGAWEAGVRVSAAYPGTPSTEITEALAGYPEIDVEWSVNEKVSLEVAIGASMAGVRAIASMKQVGVNVAADALFSVVYAGVSGGLVIVTADEPGMHSSQNEQDNRYYAKFAQVPMLEPSDSQEAKDMTRLAFQISEQYDTPVLLRLTTRICHTAGIVELGRRDEPPRRPYVKNAAKYTMVPNHALQRHFAVEKRQTLLEALANTSELNRTEMRSLEYGVITSGISYHNTREVLPDFSILKIGLTYPVPHQLIRNFASQVKYLYVIEETRPFLEEEIRALGIKVDGKEQLLRIGELSATELGRRIRHVQPAQQGAAEGVPGRPPQLCPGCGHRGIFHLLAKHKLVVIGDIGCYALAALPPYNAMDSLICMGASIGMDHGFRKVAAPEERSVAVIGDSTFFHGGMTNLLNLICNRGTSTTLILDNRITAMTGHQPNPASGTALPGQAAPRADIAVICRAFGAERVFELDGYDLPGLEQRLLEELATPGPSVLVIRERCVITERAAAAPAQAVLDTCRNCKICLRLGCPALTVEDGDVRIIDGLCYGCGVCAQVCPHDAIAPAGGGKERS